MGEKRRVYSDEFKKDAVELSNQPDKTAKEVADNLGVPYGNLMRWRREYRHNGDNAFPGQGNEQLTFEEKKIKQLKKDLKDAETERDILKKAVSIFSKKPK